MYPDVAESGVDPWHHYVVTGKKKGLDNGMHPDAAEFIPQIYLDLNDDVRQSGVDPWMHYAKNGKKEKRMKSAYPFFDQEWYLSHYPQVRSDPDVKSGKMSAEAHYYFKGWKSGYDPSVNFDTSYYLSKYRDVRERNICPLTHYLAVGRSQNRQPYNPHDLTEHETVLEFPEPYENGYKPKECAPANPEDIEDNALLIMLAEHLGDIVANEPVARYLKWKYPDRPVYWVIESRFADVVCYNPFLRGYIEVKSLKDCIELTRNLRGGQKIVNMFFDGRPDQAADPRYYWHSHDNGIGFGNFYANDCLLSSMTQAAGLDRLLVQPRFWEKPEYSSLSKEQVWYMSGLAEAVKKTVRKADGCQVILLHTKANDPKRDWTGEKFSELTDKLLNEYPEAVIAELGMTPIVKSDSSRFVTLKSITDLQLIYQIIKHADLFIGIDSSFMHMANASGTESVFITGRLYQFSHHCPYSGRFWKGDGVTFVRPRMEDESPAVEVNDVLKAVKSKLPYEN